MEFSYFDYQTDLYNVVRDASKYIENDNMEKIQELLLTHSNLGCYMSYSTFANPSHPVYHVAIENGMEDIAYLLYMSSPVKIKNHTCTNTIDNINIVSDILGDAIFHKRYELVKKLLSLDGIYKFDINGFKNSSNFINNCYIATKESNTGMQFNNDDQTSYVSSPLMICVLTGDFEMYNLIKKYNPYFNIENINCKFHYVNCNNPKIKDDLLIHFL